MRRKPRLVRKVHVVGMVAIWLAAGGLLSQEPDFASFPELFVSPQVERAVCGRSQRCRVVWIRSAGKNFAGDSLDVVRDRKSTRLNSSHVEISYAVFCLKKKKKKKKEKIDKKKKKKNKKEINKN